MLVEGTNHALVKEVKNLFNELGYIIVNDEPEIIISISSISRTIKKFLRKYYNRVIINIVEDGSAVIPITKEHLGGAFIASIIADALGSNLILTSPTGVRGLYSVEEFSWLNGLNIHNKDPKIIKHLNNKLLKDKNINIYFEQHNENYTLYEGYSVIDNENSADIIITNDEKIITYNNKKKNKLILTPAGISVGLNYLESTPLEVLVYAIKMTLKSLYILNNRVDYLIVPKNTSKDEKIYALSRFYSSKIIYVKTDYENNQFCNNLLENVGAKILLKEVRRAFGILTCLGIKINNNL